MMSLARRICVRDVLLAAAALCVAAPAAEAEESPAKTSVDRAGPDTWEAAIAELQRQEYALADALIAVAKDEKRGPDERRKAIFTLSDLRNRHSLEYLIENVSLKLPGPKPGAGDDPLREMPCAYVLAEGRDWGTGQAIIFGLDSDAPRAPRDLMLLAHVLERTFGKDLALAAVDATLAQDVPSRGPWRTNLTGIKSYLQQ